MKKKYRILKPGEGPTPPINSDRHKDLGKLQANYDKALRSMHGRPLYKDPKAFVFILLIILVTWLISVYG